MVAGGPRGGHIRLARGSSTVVGLQGEACAPGFSVCQPPLQISVSGGVHFDLVKRILRDIQRTGQKPHEVMQQITDTVFPMYKVSPSPLGLP